jgi:hypothetical protein
MIRYHGTPITPAASAVQILKGRHGLVSFERTEQAGLVAEMCQSFVLDNGAFSHWRAGKGVVDVVAYAAWVRDWYRHPGFDWCLIPDIIDGSEQDNRTLVQEWTKKILTLHRSQCGICTNHWIGFGGCLKTSAEWRLEAAAITASREARLGRNE